MINLNDWRLRDPRQDIMFCGEEPALSYGIFHEHGPDDRSKIKIVLWKHLNPKVDFDRLMGECFHYLSVPGDIIIPAPGILPVGLPSRSKNLFCIVACEPVVGYALGTAYEITAVSLSWRYYAVSISESCAGR